MKNPTEAKIQQEIYIYFNNHYCLASHKPRCSIFAIPNGGKRDAREAKTLKNTGVKRGVADLEILIPGKCIFIEVKTLTGQQSDEQKDFQMVCEGLGIDYFLVRSLEEFKELCINPNY